MNRVLTGAGNGKLVKLHIAEGLQGKKKYLLPVSECGINLKTADINDLLKVYGIQSMARRPALPLQTPAPAKNLKHAEIE